MDTLKVLCPQAALVKKKDGGSLALGIVLSIGIGIVLWGVAMVLSFIVGLIIGALTLGFGAPIAWLIGFVIGLLPAAYLIVGIIACVNNYNGDAKAEAVQTEENTEN